MCFIFRSSLLMVLVAWATTTGANTDSLASLEVQECLTYTKRYLRTQPVICGPQSIQVNAPKSVSQYSGTLKFGGFNLKHLGTATDAITRDYEAVAEMINQWDVVGILETEDWSKANFQRNLGLDRVLAARADLLELILPSYAVPAQITLLKALQTLDPSWAMVMTTTPQGELGNDGTISQAENGLQYFRGSKISPRPIAYCGGDFACSQRFSVTDAPLVSRPPLIASYQAGRFPFILASTHTRFNEPVRADSLATFESGLDRLYRTEVSERLKKLSSQEKTALGNTGPGWVNALDRQTLRGVAKALKFYSETVKGFRLVETWVVLTELQRLSQQERTPRVIFQGDFNLEPSDFERFSESFFSANGSMPKGKVHVEDLTSISTKTIDGKILANAYDHLIFVPENVPECDGSGAKAFNYTAMPRYMGTSFSYRAQRAIRRAMDAARSSYKAGVGEKDLVPLYSEKELQKLEATFDRGLINPPASAQNQPIFRLFSDHIPISMDCQI